MRSYVVPLVVLYGGVLRAYTAVTRGSCVAVAAPMHARSSAQVTKDWENREVLEVVRMNVLSLTNFLTQFGASSLGCCARCPRPEPRSRVSPCLALVQCWNERAGGACEAA